MPARSSHGSSPGMLILELLHHCTQTEHAFRKVTVADLCVKVSGSPAALQY